MRDLWQAGAATPLHTTVNDLLRGNAVSATASMLSENSARACGLTARELEVLKLLRDGHSNRKIAEHLFIGERTAQTHVQHILAKLDVNTRTAAVAVAVERQLI
jgi:DNA-binding NarL/FixJ family response regulator